MLVLRSVLPDTNVPGLSASWQATCTLTTLGEALYDSCPVSVRIADVRVVPCGMVTFRKRAPRVVRMLAR